MRIPNNVMHVFSSGIYISFGAIAVIAVIVVIILILHGREKEKEEEARRTEESARLERERAAEEAERKLEAEMREEREKEIAGISTALSRMGLDNSYESIKECLDWSNGDFNCKSKYRDYLNPMHFRHHGFLDEDNHPVYIPVEEVWYRCLRYGPYRRSALQFLCDEFDSRWGDFPYKGYAVLQLEQWIAPALEKFPPTLDEVRTLLSKWERPGIWLMSIKDVFEEDGDATEEDKKYPFGIVPTIKKQAPAISRNAFDDQLADIIRESPFLFDLFKPGDNITFEGSAFEAILIGTWFSESSGHPDAKEVVSSVLALKGLQSIPEDLVPKASVAACCDLLAAIAAARPDLRSIDANTLDPIFKYLSDAPYQVAVKTDVGYMWNIDKLYIPVITIFSLRNDKKPNESKEESQEYRHRILVRIIAGIVFWNYHITEVREMEAKILIDLENEIGTRKSEPSLTLIHFVYMPLNLGEMEAFLRKFIRENCF